MNRGVLLLIAIFVVYFILKEAELYEIPKLPSIDGIFGEKKEKYIPRSFSDGEWAGVRNDPRRKAGPFNTCSPESFDECAKVAFPLLSRY